MTTQKFTGHESAQAYYLSDHITGDERLQSYDTIVIDSTYDYNLKCRRYVIHGLYSATTRKHIGWYAKAHNLAYSHFKWAYDHNCDIVQDYQLDMIIFESRETGEILSIINNGGLFK